jgi:predicted metal-binding membrane protein
MLGLTHCVWHLGCIFELIFLQYHKGIQMTQTMRLISKIIPDMVMFSIIG